MMAAAVAAHWLIEMLATFMYIGIIGICTNPKHGHNRIMVWAGNHRLLTQGILAIPMAYVTVLLVDSALST